MQVCVIIITFFMLFHHFLLFLVRTLMVDMCTLFMAILHSFCCIATSIPLNRWSTRGASGIGKCHQGDCYSHAKQCYEVSKMNAHPTFHACTHQYGYVL
jgi:hypothetical protein